jgi:murein DD-endopeptidase MepM/ murein hydrolase activator NlpD
VENRGAYSPEVSGFLYGDDFVVPGGSITAEQIESAGLMALDAKGTAIVTPHARPIEKTIASPLSGMTTDGPASMLMGYAYRSRNMTSFLMTVNLTLRGDPYWLTRINTEEFTIEKPSRDSTHNPPANGTKYYFLLTIGSPTKFDFNLQDEDNNSGYWSDGRVSGTFSGLYWPQKWKNRFNNGIFTTEIKANKEISVPLQWIKRVPPGQTPPDWDSLKVTPSETQLFLDASAATSVKPDSPDSPTGPTSNPTPPNATGFRNPLGDANYRVGDGLGAGRGHGGVDLAADAGTPVYATKGGTVIFSAEQPVGPNGRSYGQVIYIDHGDGTQTRYAHLKEGSRLFTAGQEVRAGEPIGQVGNTGTSTGAHLHYEVRTGNSGSVLNKDTVPVEAKNYLGR